MLRSFAVVAAFMIMAGAAMAQSLDGRWYTEGPKFGNWFRQTLEISGNQYASHALIQDSSGFTYELVRYGNAQYFGTDNLRLVATEWAPTERDGMMLMAPPPQNFTVTYFDGGTLVLWDNTCAADMAPADCTFQYTRMQ